MKLLRLIIPISLIVPLSSFAQCKVSVVIDLTFCQGGVSQLLLVVGSKGTPLWVPTN